MYDAYGNITTNVAKTGVLSGSTVNPTETTTTNTSYSIHNTPVPAKPDNVTVYNIRTGMPTQNATATYTYNSTGLPISQTAFYGLPKAVTTSYTYNGFGNVTQTTTSASGMGNRLSNATYDARGRYPITKTVTGGSVTMTESFLYDDKWGQPVSKTTDCLTTTFEYDAFGRIKKTNMPEGYSVNNSFVWDVQGQQVFYSFVDFSGGQPDTKTWVDKLGREIKTQTAGFNGQWLTNTTTYNYKGNIVAKTNNYYNTETPVVTTTAYDVYNRPVTITNPLTTITNTYTKLTGGNFQVTTQNSAGQSSSKITDATGKVISAIDNGGQLNYTYDSRGNQVEVKHGTTIMVTSVYDVYGQQTSLTDNNAGTINYQYDAFGQLTQQTDNSGNTYTMVYDDLGRIVSRSGTEGTITYSYFAPGFGRCSNQKLQSVTGFNGVTKRYGYDSYNRLQTERITIDGVNYTTTYTYDTYGNLTKTTYPSGVEVNNSYDASGGLVSITGGDSWNPVTLFTANAVNGFGQYTNYTLGNGKTSQNTYQYGIPTRFYTPGVQDLNFTFDYTKGNLLSRYDAIKNLTENFQYDNLNRLTNSTVNGVQQLAINYDGTGSFSMGNITSKTDAGNYVYKNDKIHAVAYITNPAGPTAPPVSISPNMQQISYTAFLKTASVTEGGIQTDFTYGPDYQRVKSQLYVSGSASTSKIYTGTMERVTDGSYTRDVHYISAGNGLAAIIEKQLYGNSIIHFIYSDYLGSLLTKTDINGTITAEQNFDAWGRGRGTSDWQYASYANNSASFYDRGYTGHEHMVYHALVNMNGRIYDPIQGRMLSPDNYVGDPWNTQGYNRYSYANNNPLVYTDPDGNWIIPVLIAAAIGAGTSAATYAVSAAISGTWNWGSFFKSVGMGALAGAIGGGVAQIGISWGASANSLGLNIISNVSAQAGSNLAFGNNVSAGMIFGSILGGVVSHGIGNYSGVKGGSVKNIVSEIGFNSFKYGISGAFSVGVGAMIDGGDVNQGFANGARYSAIGGLALSTANILTMGPSYKPEEDFGDFGRYAPVYRKGTFITRAIFKEGTGVALGRNLVTHLAKPGGYIDNAGYNIDDFNRYLQAHETGHYAQQIRMGFGGMYQKTLNDYSTYGLRNVYGTPGTLEYLADRYSLNRIGYYYNNHGRQTK